MNYTIEQILQLWGRGSRERIGTEYPNIAAGMKQAIVPSGYHIFNLSDDEYLTINAQMLRLKQKSQIQYDILEWVYKKKKTRETICRELNIGKDRYERQLSKAKSWLDGAFTSIGILKM